MSENMEHHCPPIASLKGTIAESTQNFFLKTDLADVYFLFETEQMRIPAHKTILAMASPTFRSMFYGPIPEQGDIRIVDSSPEEFKEFLGTLYCADVTISAANVAKVLYLADKYLAIGSLDICDQFLQQLQTIDDIVVGYDLAVQFNRIDLEKILEIKIKDQPKAVIESDLLLQCSSIGLKRILQIDHLTCYAKQLFDVCMRWAENACNNKKIDSSDVTNRKNELGECFSWIPFYMMKPTEIAQIAAAYKDLFDQDEFVDLLNIAASVGPVTSNKFRNKVDFSRNIDTCGFCWINLPDEKKQWIKKQETISSKNTMDRFLVAVKLPFIYHNGTEVSQKLSGIMSFHYNSGINSEYEIHLQQPIEMQCFQSKRFSVDERIKLIRPVEFKHGQWKFQINFDSSWEDKKFFMKRMDGEYIFKCLYFD